MNSLRYVLQEFAESEVSETPSYHRYRINTLFFTGALLFEAKETLNNSGRYVHDLDAFPKITRIFRSQEFRLIEPYIFIMRNKLTFHFDPEVAAAALKLLELPEIVFAEGMGTGTRHLHFVLADHLSLHYLFMSQNRDISEEEIGKIMQSILIIGSNLIAAGEEVVVEALYKLGWQLVDYPSTAV